MDKRIPPPLVEQDLEKNYRRLSFFKWLSIIFLIFHMKSLSAGFVRQPPKTSSNQYRSCTTGKDGPGGI
jgi:hypothetical protein